MVGVTLDFLLNYGLFFVFLLTFYIWKFYTNKFSLNHKKIALNNTWDNLLGSNLRLLYFYMFWQTILILFSKGHCKQYSFMSINLTIFLLVFFLLVLFYTLVINHLKYSQTELEVHINGCIWLICCLIVFFIIDNFLSFLLILEIIATVYFFFILVFIKNNTLTLLKLKNLISNYLWVSFFTLIILYFSLLLVVKNVGTLTFVEIYFYSEKVPFYVWHLLLISLLWKIGGPGFYFFKVELYQYLPTNSLFIFSIVSSFTGCFLLHFLFINCWPIFIEQNYALITYITIYNIFILIKGLKTCTFYQFLALSSVNTWSILLLFYLINCLENLSVYFLILPKN